MSAALDRLSELERAATSGAWRFAGSPYHEINTNGANVCGLDSYSEANAALIVAARNALPALLAVARAAEACESEWTALGALDGPDDLDDDFDALRDALAALDAP